MPIEFLERQKDGQGTDGRFHNSVLRALRQRSAVKKAVHHSPR